MKTKITIERPDGCPIQIVFNHNKPVPPEFCAELAVGQIRRVKDMFKDETQTQVYTIDIADQP